MAGGMDKMTAGVDPNDIFLRGRYVLLKALTEEDVRSSNWYGWFNDETVTAYMQKHYFPNTRQQQLAFLRNEIDGSTTKLQLGICDAIQGGPIVGVVSLQNIDYMNRQAEFAIVIGEERYRHVKYFVEAARLMMRHGFSTLNLHRIYTGTFMPNVVELMTRALGGREEGLLKEAVYKNGRYHDVRLFGVLASEFKDEPMAQGCTAAHRMTESGDQG
jgi:RimJ/RimL family protein N-acetyltransferase